MFASSFSTKRLTCLRPGVVIFSSKNVNRFLTTRWHPIIKVYIPPEKIDPATKNLRLLSLDIKFFPVVLKATSDKSDLPGQINTELHLRFAKRVKGRGVTSSEGEETPSGRCDILTIHGRIDLRSRLLTLRLDRACGDRNGTIGIWRVERVCKRVPAGHRLHQSFADTTH